MNGLSQWAYNAAVHEKYLEGSFKRQIPGLTQIPSESGSMEKWGWKPTFKGAQVTQMLSQFADLYTSPCHSKCGPDTINIYVTWEIVRSEEPQVPPRVH